MPMTERARRLPSTAYPFEPAGGASLAVTSTTGSVALAGTGNQAVITNPSAAAVYVELGTSTVVATVASMCILPRTSVLVTIPETADTVRSTHLAAITAVAADTATIQVSTGWGL